MSIKSKVKTVLARELGALPAWLPITNTFALGDFGVISGSVFHRLGNIRDYGVDFEAVPGEPSKLVFTSESGTQTRFAAGVEVDVFPEAPLEARLEIDFSAEDALLIRANPIEILEMKDTLEVANRIQGLTFWRGKYKVVNKVYTASACVFVSTRSKDTKVSVVADATALKKLDIGEIGADIGLSADKSLGLEVTGERGVIALGLFKLNWLGNVRFLERAEVAVTQLTLDDLEEDDL